MVVDHNPKLATDPVPAGKSTTSRQSDDCGSPDVLRCPWCNVPMTLVAKEKTVTIGGGRRLRMTDVRARKNPKCRGSGL